MHNSRGCMCHITIRASSRLCLPKGRPVGCHNINNVDNKVWSTPIACPIRIVIRLLLRRTSSQTGKSICNNMDNIDQFFALYPSFDYDRTASSPREFYRLCDTLQWKKNHDGDYPPERDEAYEAFRKAMVESFNQRFGVDVNDRRSWEAVCDLLRIEPLPESVEGMKKVSWTLL